MINNAYVTQGQNYLQAYVIPPPTPYVSSTETMAGIVRIKSGMWQVNDGCTWQTMSNGSINLNLTPEAIEILNWAKTKMSLEQRAIELARKNPSIADALEQVRRAEQELQVLTILSE